MGTLIKQSLLSGILVGIGVVVNASVTNQYVGAMLFSIALLVIIKCGLKLYTGKIGYISENNCKDLPYMLFFNTIGVLIPVFIACFLQDGMFEAMQMKANIKFSKTHFQLFLSGLMCGVLMFIAVHCKETIITVFCIMTFILSGYEHCIAAYPYYCLADIGIQNLTKFLCIILGNSIGSIFTHWLIKKRE